MFSAIVPYVKLWIMFVARWSSRLTRWELRKFGYIWYVLPLRACWRACGGARCWKANSKRRVGKVKSRKPARTNGGEKQKHQEHASVSEEDNAENADGSDTTDVTRYHFSSHSLTFASLSPQIALSRPQNCFYVIGAQPANVHPCSYTTIKTV